MKPITAFLLLATGVVVAEAGNKNPITRIVNLLRGLSDKLEKDLDAETDLFETYKCWFKTTTANKEASNEAAKSRIDSLKNYIADIEAGKIEFTSERVELEKQIKTLSADLKQAKDMRSNEHSDFLAAEKEMEMGISALKEALKTINDATEGSLVQKRSYLGMLATRHSVQKAMMLGRGILDSSDVKYLSELLDGDVPKPDWKKLNRKAGFKMKYKKRSGGILKTLGALQTTFEANLADARQKEKDELAAYEKLKKSKEDMLDTATKALSDAALEKGAQGASKAESQKEVDALEAQVEADTKFIKEAEEAFKVKSKEWAGREELRKKEMLAMSQAIAVLASDDAKDQMKESFKSQGYLLLQEAVKHQTLAPARRAKCAARLVNSLAEKSGDVKLLQLANRLGSDAIDKVVAKIDEIVENKKDEEEEDLKKKQKCEEDLSDAAAKSKKASLDMDTDSEDIARAESKTAELKGQIKEQQKKKADLEGQVEDITKQRKRENEDFHADKLADQKAVELIENAAEILKDWKNAKKEALISKTKMTAIAGALHEIVTPEAASLIQVRSSKQSPEDFAVDAGKAPPPPPATWEGGEKYGGAKGESAGIMGILEMVKEDVEKDIKAGEDSEAEAVKDFEEQKADLEGEIKSTQGAIDAYKEDKAAQEQIVTDKTSERATTAGELDGHIKEYEGYKPGCDFLLINFETRTKTRQIEVDGLQKAKAILQGADFGKGEASFLQVQC